MKLFNYWKKEDQFIAANKSLWVIIVSLLLINLFLAFAFMKQPDKIKVYLPPDISKGGVINADDIPDSTVYAFAFQIFSGINSWPDEGSTDYSKNIYQYRNYVSSNFNRYLTEDIRSKRHNSALNRKRVASVNQDQPFSTDSIESLGNGSWKVNLNVNIVETINNSIIKDVDMDYPLIVSRKNMSIQENPWVLVISGFFDQPHRVKTNI